MDLQPRKRGGQPGNRGGQPFRSGRRIASVATLDKLISKTETIALRAINDENTELHSRAKDLALPLILKRMADRSEQVIVNLNLSDELMRRIMQRLNVVDEKLTEPNDIYITPVIKPNASEPNEPNALDESHAPSPDQPQ